MALGPSKRERSHMSKPRPDRGHPGYHDGGQKGHMPELANRHDPTVPRIAVLYPTGSKKKKTPTLSTCQTAPLYEKHGATGPMVTEALSRTNCSQASGTQQHYLTTTPRPRRKGFRRHSNRTFKVDQEPPSAQRPGVSNTYRAHGQPPAAAITRTHRRFLAGRSKSTRGPAESARISSSCCSASCTRAIAAAQGGEEGVPFQAKHVHSKK